MVQSLHPYLLGLWCLLVLPIWGCDEGPTVLEEETLVQFKDKALTREQLNFYIPNGIPEQDSARYAQQFINQWLKEQAVMDIALGEDEDLANRIAFKVEDYRAKLIMHEYESQLIEKSLDQEIPDSLIQKFYNNNREYFKSQEDLYSYFYFATTENDLSQADRWMRSSKQEDLAKLMAWSETNSLEAKLDSTYDGETKITQLSKGYYGSLKKVRIGQLIQWTGVIQGERRKYRFKLLKVVKTGEYLPVALCEEKITKLLLNERRIELIEETENKIVKDAEAQNYIQR